MRAEETDLPGVLVLEPRVFADARGFFMESYNRRTLADVAGIADEFVQDNHSRSVKGTLRGLHYQIREAQGKLVRAIRGAVWDVAIDLRRSSPSFGRWVGVELSEDNRRMLWVPVGFAHGFLVLSDIAEVLYKATDFYAPAHERAILWNDPQLAIRWPLDGEPVVSEKDAGAPLLRDAELFD
jgi:dTDP-4-dehydrorhamnose 3,5-epimerase